MVSSAAHRRVCSPLGVFAARVTQVVALVFFLASSAPAAGLGNPPAPASSDTVLFSASLDLLTGKEVIKDHAQASPTAPAQQPPVPQQGVIERIEFIGNRRVRTDTLKARIFSREGDPYNEDTLDRFKERKVGLTVESEFDPTKIKKAEVVLKEILGEHGRQFAKVTPEY